MRLALAGVPLPGRTRRAFRARYLLAGVCGLSLLAAAGCGTSSSAGSAVSDTVTIAAVPGVDDASLYLAQKDGLFAAEGLEHVRIETFPNQAQVISALQSAKADIAASDYGDVFSLEAQSAHPKQPLVRILADGYDATPGVLEVLTLPGSTTVTSPMSLSSPKVVVGLPNDDYLKNLSGAGVPVSLDAAAATDVLSDYLGVAADSVQWKPMSQAQEVTQLEQHKLQAILVSEPYIYQAESKDGAIEVLDACSGSTAGLPLLGYVAMNAWVRENPTAVADFQAALAKAQADATVAGKVQAVLPSAAGVSAQVADLITVGSYPTSTSIPNLQAVVRLMYNSRMISNSPAVPPMIVKPAS
ncbi:MAG TPA: ABC transporter substrate-binding protein [Streptosporangiaceae bacterium]|nr:ABC transporter substrate-binding protein [Streptosporangiaceae bacterium]